MMIPRGKARDATKNSGAHQATDEAASKEANAADDKKHAFELVLALRKSK